MNALQHQPSSSFTFSGTPSLRCYSASLFSPQYLVIRSIAWGLANAAPLLARDRIYAGSWIWTFENSASETVWKIGIASNSGFYQRAKGVPKPHIAVFSYPTYAVENPFSYFPNSFSRHLGE